MPIVAAHEKIRTLLQSSPLWNFERERRASMNGEYPEEALIQIALECDLHELQPAWRFSQWTLAALFAAKGIPISEPSPRSVSVACYCGAACSRDLVRVPDRARV